MKRWSGYFLWEPVMFEAYFCPPTAYHNNTESMLSTLEHDASNL